MSKAVWLLVTNTVPWGKPLCNRVMYSIPTLQEIAIMCYVMHRWYIPCMSCSHESIQPGSRAPAPTLDVSCKPHPVSSIYNQVCVFLSPCHRSHLAQCPLCISRIFVLQFLAPLQLPSPPRSSEKGEFGIHVSPGCLFSTVHFKWPFRCAVGPIRSGIPDLDQCGKIVRKRSGFWP